MTNLCMLLKQKSIQRQKMLFLTEIAVIAFFYKSLAKDVWHRYLKTLLHKPYPSNLACKVLYLPVYSFSRDFSTSLVNTLKHHS